ncbi:transcription-repair coupling factor [Pontibacter amylolyticus]|uniref:Transcription-repair-coupling factor n=1 Tax=Pontibacter amylolyticus TaxID=1424080 RepID=A0ABQ1VZY2_9BACT|nr:transcription-repair coupling factor [Pontibacter amylolyticus]GGG08043.1 transcription-repair-coupling factor [Pontibacter amylolyticus]
MKVTDFLELYRLDGVVQTIAERLKADKPYRLQLKGMAGSLDAVMASAVYTLHPQHQLFVLHDKEEAAYFYTDLKNLLGDEKEVMLFPTSYKRPYSFDDTENANILMRAEVLNRLNTKSDKGELIVTYPEALTEKVINKKSLVENTLGAKVGEKLDVNFLSEMLAEYGFERTEFVYEAGQYAVRGGIVDVFSYANDLPYRIELFGDEIESIRSFDPDTQLSVETKKSISIIPNVQTKLLQETREAFLDFLPKNTAIWFKDVRQTLDVIDEYFDKAAQAFEKLMAGSGGTQIVSDPEQLFQTQKQFKKLLEKFSIVEFGKRFNYKDTEVLQFQSKPQPSFNKDFNRLVKDLHEQQSKGFVNVIATDSPRQINRLTTIFDELDHDMRFQHLGISLREGFIDEQLKITCYTDHQLFDRFYQHKAKEGRSKSKAMTLKELRTLQPGDYITHMDYGVGRFAGLEKVEVGGRLQEAIRLVYRDDDLLYVSIHSLHKISKYSGKEGGPPTMSKLGSPEWENKKKKVKSKVKDIAAELIQLYAKRKAAPGYAYTRDGFLQAELESSFIYEDTPDQGKATEDVKADMEQPHPMDRLVCGDVGFGKTEVAIRAAFKAACDGKQVAVLVPTTVLAMQHFKTFRDRLEQFPVTVDYINRFKTTKDIKNTLQRVAEGKVDILIGTHRIVSKDVKFKDLGLLVIDEEQKFGVKTKEKLKEMRFNVDTLTLTATPIPRTLHFSLMGARDLSVIATPPPNRQPVKTELHVFDEILIRDAVATELKRGGQVFFVHNRVKDIEEIANMILKLVPDARITFAHGQMDGETLEKRMMKFVDGEYDVLVSTNIIESGLDIPNANTIIINRAHMFGLSDLHQMRGRVGRSNKKAYCYLLTPPVAGLPTDARKRLSVLEEFSDLGEGFKIAMRDLDIRGAGNLLGGEQSGFINDLGFEMYHQVLDDAIKELKETEFRDLFLKDNLAEFVEPVRDCNIETDMEVLIPDWYVGNISERLNLYSKLDSTKDLQDLEKLQASIVDRFGPLPQEVQKLIEIVKLRWQAQQLGFEKLTIKKEVMKGYLPSENNDAYFQSETFGNILKYVQQHSRRSRLKEAKDKLIVIVEDIQSIADAREVFDSLDVKATVQG